MGYYINPVGVTKEKWLHENGLQISDPPAFHTEDGNVAVCWVNNGMFTAAAIAYNQYELETFADNSRDRRPKKWYWVPISKAQEFMDGRVIS